MIEPSENNTATQQNAIKPRSYITTSTRWDSCKFIATKWKRKTLWRRETIRSRMSKRQTNMDKTEHVSLLALARRHRLNSRSKSSEILLTWHSRSCSSHVTRWWPLEHFWLANVESYGKAARVLNLKGKLGKEKRKELFTIFYPRGTFRQYNNRAL